MAYKVKFDNGTVVSFENEPTQQDIDEASQHLAQNIKPAPVKEQPKGFFEKIGGPDSIAGKIGTALGNAVDTTVKTVAGLGISGANVVEGIKDLATGSQTYDPNKSRNIPGLGKVDPFITGQESFGEGVGKMFSGGAEVAALLPTGKIASGAKKVAEVVAEQAPKLGKKIVSAAEKFASETATKMAEKKATSRVEALTNIVSPKLTKAVRQEALGAGEDLTAKEIAALSPDELKAYNDLRQAGVKTTGAGPAKKTNYVPDADTQDIVTRVKNAGVSLKTGVDQFGKNIRKLQIAERQKFNEATNMVKDYVKGKGSRYIPEDADNIISMLETKIQEAKKLPQRTFDLATDTDKTYDKIWNIAVESLREKVSKTGKLTQENILDALRNMNYKSSEVAAFEGKENIKKIAIKDIRQIFRDTLVNSLPKNTGKKLDNIFKDQHAFIDAMSNIRDKGEIIVGAKSNAERAWNIAKKNAVGVALGLSAAGGVASGINALRGE